MKVLHLPTTTGGNPQGLSKHLNILGLDSVTWTIQQNYFNYPADVVICDRNDGVLLCQARCLRWVFKELFQFDVIHFNYGSTLFSPVHWYTHNLPWWKRVLSYLYMSFTSAIQLAELSLLKLLKKPMFIHYQGTDARQGDYCLEHFKYNIISQMDDSRINPYSDAFKRSKINRLARYCEKIYAVNPDLLHVLPQGSRFIPYCHISLDEWQPVYNQHERNDRPLRIGHAPSDRSVKGTEKILAALDELEAEGYEFERVMVEGLNHADARKLYETVDVLVDQLNAGWYGGLAVEAMALGKPVLVYIREDDLQFIPEKMKADLPFIQVNPDTIKIGLKKILDMSGSELLALAERSRAFVEEWHDPLKIAKEIKADYEVALRKYGKI